MEAQATARNVRTSAQKAGLVCELIRGKGVNQALETAVGVTYADYAKNPDEAIDTIGLFSLMSPVEPKNSASP